MAYGVLAKLGLNQYTVKKKKKKITSGARERKDSAVHYMACLCWCCRARRNKK